MIKMKVLLMWQTEHVWVTENARIKHGIYSVLLVI